MNSSFPQFLFLILRIPYFLVVVAGLVLALMWWRRMPMVALWAALGFGCLLVGSLAGFAMFPAMQLVTNLLGSTGPSSPQNIALLISASTTLLSTAGLGMLIVAIFGWREPVVPPK